MIERIIKLLKEHKEIVAYNIKTVTTYSHEVYLIKQTIDLNRASSIVEYAVTIFCSFKNKSPKMFGDSSFSFDNSITDEELENKINTAIAYCKCNVTFEYALPKKRTLKPIVKEVGFDGYSLQTAAYIVADTLFEADKFEKSYINSARINLSFTEIKYIDSNDNSFVNSYQNGYIYMVASALDEAVQKEMAGGFEFLTIDQKFITQEANRLLLSSYDKAKAIKTPVLSSCRVVLQDQNAKKFFEFFVNKASNDFNYLNYRHYSNGSIIQKMESGKQDLITIRLEPNLKGSNRNSFFDNDGVASKRVNVIEKGVIKNMWGSNKYSQLLHHQVSGKMENIIVNHGSLTKEELEQDTYLEIVELSNFDINEITGDFASEIILANLYQKGKSKQPVSGGAIIGNIYDCLKDVRFSNEVGQLNNYMGPKKVLINNIKVLKGD